LIGAASNLIEHGVEAGGHRKADDNKASIRQGCRSQRVFFAGSREDRLIAPLYCLQDRCCKRFGVRSGYPVAFIEPGDDCGWSGGLGISYCASVVASR